MKNIKSPIIKKIYISLIIMLISILIVPNVYASTDDNVNVHNVSTKSTACLLIETKTGKVLYSKNANKRMYPASTTKLMTAILTAEKCQMTDKVKISHNAIFSIPYGYASANFREGEELSVENLLNVLLIPSANDAAVALAEHISGSVGEFSKLMNSKAKEIGCTGTNFVNPNGIHNENHYSTAHDLSLIGQYAMKLPTITNIVKKTRYTLPATSKYKKTDRVFKATNKLINSASGNSLYYQYATGLKTGYTDKAGNCIVATAKKDKLELIAVTLNAKTSENRFEDCKKLFDYGFKNYSYRTIKKANDVIKSVEISNATDETKTLDIILKDDISAFFNNNINIKDIDSTIDIKENLQAPIAEHSVVGKVTYKIDGKEYSSDLLAGSSVYPSNMEVIIFKIALGILVFFVLCLILRRMFASKKDRYGSTYRINNYNSHKKTRKNKRHKSRGKRYAKGNYKFTQIDDYL